MAQIYLRLKALYEKEGGPVPEPIVNLALALQGSERSDAGRDRQGDQRLRRRRRHRSERSDQGLIAEGQAGCQLRARCATTARPPCGCWIYSGCFTEAGNKMARRDNSDPDDTGVYLEVGVLVAGQPPHPLQPRVGGPERQAVGSEPQADRVGRREMDGLRRAGHRADGEAGRGRPVHHEPGRDRAAVHPRHDARRAVPGALRAVRIADRQPDRAEGPRQSGRPRVQGRHGAVRRRQGVPLRGDLLPADRALPLLDQARPAQRRDAAGVLCRDLRSSSRRRRASSPAAGSGCGRSADR